MAAMSQTTFSNAFSWMKMYEFRLKFHWSLFLRVQLTISHHWFRWWLGAGQATSHCLKQCWLVCWRINASLGLNELTPVRRQNTIWNITGTLSIEPLEIHFSEIWIQQYSYKISAAKCWPFAIVGLNRVISKNIGRGVVLFLTESSSTPT